MAVAELKDSTIFAAPKVVGDMQDAIKEVDWRGHIIKFFSFGIENLQEVSTKVQSKEFLDPIQKAYTLCEYIPIINTFCAFGRLFGAALYTSKVMIASWTIRPFKLGIIGTISVFWKEELPYILKQTGRSLLILAISSNGTIFSPNDTKFHTDPLLLSVLLTYGYDAVTNNFESIKNNKYIPNFWA